MQGRALVPSSHAQPGLPHFVAVSMALIKWCLERTGCAPPLPAQGGGAEAAAAPLSSLGPPGERLGQERGWCSSSCAPRPGRGVVSSRIGFLSPLTSPSRRGGGVDI